MSALDLTQLERPVSEENPSGENLEYDALFLSLENLAAGVPASRMGDSVVEGKDPDWRALRKNCLALWERSRDLRIAAYLTVAELALEGLDGFADGLELMRWLVAEQWDTFWPRLDPEDDNDPLERLNIFSMISPPPGAYDDPLRIVMLFREQRLVPEGPSYTLRDLIAAEEDSAPADGVSDLHLITVETAALPPEIPAARRELVQRVSDLLSEISAAFESHAEQYSLSFSTLVDELKRLRRFFGQFSGPSAVAEEGAEDVGESAVPAPPGVPAGNGAVNIATVHARSRADALMLLRKGCEYFRSAEPTSPVPFLIDRAIRMAEMNFMDLLAEIDSNAVERGRDILGVRRSEDS